MWRKVLFVCGIVLFLGSVGLTVYFVGANLLAIASTHEEITNQGAGGGPRFASWNVNARPVMSQDETQALTITVSQELGSRTSTITLNAPGFNISPSKSERELNMTQGAKVNFSWILTPTQPGIFTIAVEYLFDGNIDTKYIGISVTNVLGLNSFQIQLLSYIGTFLAPICTAPFLIGKLQEYLRKRKNKANIGVKTQKASKNYDRRRRRRY